jgi:hypothetical protein
VLACRFESKESKESEGLEGAFAHVDVEGVEGRRSVCSTNVERVENRRSVRLDCREVENWSVPSTFDSFEIPQAAPSTGSFDSFGPFASFD